MEPEEDSADRSPRREKRGTLCPHTEDTGPFKTEIPRWWTFRGGLVTPQEGHVLHLRSVQATDVFLFFFFSLS